MTTTTELPRVPLNASQRKRVDNLVKQANDATLLLAEENLMLDTASVDALLAAQCALQYFAQTVAEQPTIPDRLTANQANAFPKRRWQ